MVTKILVCGSRRYLDNSYKSAVYNELLKAKEEFGKISLIEGCCKSSADEVAEIFAIENGIEIEHHPSHSGNYLKRNIEMVNKADVVFGFWNKFSYGTAQCLCYAVLKGKKVRIFDISLKGDLK